MARSSTMIWGDRPVRLTFPGPFGPMVALGGADARGAEHLHGMLSDELRAMLTSGGCGLRRWKQEIVSLVTAAGGRAAVELRGDARGLHLVATPAAGGPPLVRELVAADFVFTITWEGAARSLPMLAPDEGEADWWAALPPRARLALEADGRTRASVNAGLRQQLTQRQVAGGVPEVSIVIPDLGALKREKRGVVSQAALTERRARRDAGAEDPAPCVF